MNASLNVAQDTFYGTSFLPDFFAMASSIWTAAPHFGWDVDFDFGPYGFAGMTDEVWVLSIGGYCGVTQFVY